MSRATPVLLVAASICAAVAPGVAAAQSSPEPCAARSSIGADPNPVPADRTAETTTITWSSPPACAAEAYVSFAGGELLLFGGGPSGVQEAPWIRRGEGPYRFVLATSPQDSPLAGVTVTTVLPADRPFATFSTPTLRWGMLWPALLFAGVIGAGLLVDRWRGRPVRRLVEIAAVAATAAAVVPVLAVDLRPLADQPFPDAQEYADAARQLAQGDGYVTEVYAASEFGRQPYPPEGEPRPPRYPPGFSTALAPFALVSTYPWNVQRGAQLLAALYVLVAVVAAWSLGGALAAGFAASLVAAAPFATTYGSLVLSDAFAAALLLVLVALVQRVTPARTALAGAVAGAATVVRLVAGLAIPLLLLVLPAKRRLLAFVTAAPFLLLLAWAQWWSYGSPLTTGYRYWFPKLDLFGLSYATESPPFRGDGTGIVVDVLHGDLLQWACPCGPGGAQGELPNLVFYPAVLLGLFWIFAPPLATLPGLVYVWRRRRERAAGLTLWITAASLATFVFFFHQGARFLAGPATLLAVWTAVAAAAWVAPRLGYAPADVSSSGRGSGGSS